MDDDITDLGDRAEPPETDREKIERLHGIAAEMMACRTEHEVYQLTVQAARRILEFDICGIDAVENGWLIPEAVSAAMDDVGYQRTSVEDGGIAGRAYRTGESVVTDDVETSDVADPATDEYRSVLTVPVGEIGVFQAGSREVAMFDESDLELAELLLSHTEEALRRIRFEAALQERNRTIEQLHETAAELVGCETESAVYELVVAAAEEVLDFRVCVVLATGPGEDDRLTVRASTDDEMSPDKDAVIQAGSGVAWRTYESGTSAVVDDVEASAAAEPYHGSYRSAISVPLGDVGVLQAIATDPDAFDAEDRELAELLASQASEVISRLRAERRRTDEHDRLAALFRNVPDPAVSMVFDDDEAVIRAINPAFEAVFGFDEETAVGSDLDELVVPAGDRSAARAVNHSARRGESFHMETRRLTTGGEERDFLLHVVPIERVPDNPGAYAIYTDITDRKRREQRLSALHESTRELIAADDATAVCERAVEAARETLGLDVCGVHFEEEGAMTPVAWTDAAGELFEGSPPTYGPEATNIWRAFDRDDQLVYEVDRIESADSDVVVEATLVVPLGEWGVFIAGAGTEDTFTDQVVDLAGVLAASVETALDRTERERALRERERELQRQNERLEEFATVVSHDLRNPLSVARGNLDLARETGDDEYFENVSAAHERMAGLIEDLLALARGGQVVGETGPVALPEAAQRAWANVKSPVATLSVGEVGDVVADADRLVQLLENLFRNAVEHGSTGPPSDAQEDAVEHGSTSPRHAEDAVEHGSTGSPSDAQEDAQEHDSTDVAVAVRATEHGFAVTDDGPGIPAEDHDRVLEYGYSTDKRGTGLGLAIVREIAEAHGWTVEVGESDEGGARFEIRTE